MVVAWVILKGDWGFEERQRRLLEKIDKMTDEELMYYIQERGRYDEGEIEEMTIEDKRQIHRDIIKNLFACLNNRDVAVIYRGEEKMFISGGLSWGDSPTSSYENIDELTFLSPELLEVGGIE